MKENNSATRRHLLKIKIIAFILIFVLLLAYFNRVLTYSSYVVESRWMTEIYKEKENSLDAVYIGSSKVYAYWNPTLRGMITELKYIRTTAHHSLSWCQSIL